MLAIAMTHTELLGTDTLELAASGALHTVREIVQQPAMLKATHALVAALRTQLDAFTVPITSNPARTSPVSTRSR